MKVSVIFHTEVYNSRFDTAVRTVAFGKPDCNGKNNPQKSDFIRNLPWVVGVPKTYGQA